jgi:hypothetical protein
MGYFFGAYILVPIVFSLPTLAIFLYIEKQPSWRLVRLVSATALFFLLGAISLLVLCGLFFDLPGEGMQVLYGAFICVSVVIGQIIGYIRYRRIRETPETAPWLLVRFPSLAHVGRFLLICSLYFFGAWVVLGLAPLAFKMALLEKPYGGVLIFSVPLALAIGHAYWRYKIKERF